MIQGYSYVARQTVQQQQQQQHQQHQQQQADSASATADTTNADQQQQQQQQSAHTAAAAAAAVTALKAFPPVLMDISFEGQRHNGQAANRLVQSLIDEHPALRPLVLVLKQFLKERGLCVSYTGGLSSYALVLLVARYLQEQASHAMDAGSLLWGFLDFFGNVFDPRTTGISVSRSCYFSRGTSSTQGASVPPAPSPGGQVLHICIHMYMYYHYYILLQACTERTLRL
jgi:Cid1 family poly A polymerase